MKDKIKEFLLNLFFPRFCLGCKKEGIYLCDDCKATLGTLEYQYCLCNKNPVRLSRAGKCKRCHHKTLSGLYFALSYQESSLTKKLIHYFKYPPYIKELGITFSSLIIEHFLLSGKDPKKIFKNGLLIPVPITKKELKKRGFNQAEEIAQDLSKILKISLS